MSEATAIATPSRGWRRLKIAAIAAACANPAQLAAAIDAARLAQITPLQNAYRRQHTESH